MHLKTFDLKLEIKALEDGQFEGYGSVFNNLDLTGDVMAPGAFSTSLADHKTAGTLPLMLWMHRPDQVAGAWARMKEDARGLSVKGNLADTDLGKEMHTLLKMKAVRGLSVGFRTRDAEWLDDEERGIHRVIKDVDLVEVSIVSLAANPLAEVSAVKSRLSSEGVYVPNVTEAETMLRKGGFSKTASRAMLRKMFGSGATLDAGDDVKSGAMLDLEQRLSKLALAMKTEPVADVEPIKPAPFWR